MVIIGINNVKYLKPCYASSALGCPGSTSMQMTLEDLYADDFVVIAESRNVSGDS